MTVQLVQIAELSLDDTMIVVIPFLWAVILPPETEAMEGETDFQVNFV